MNYSELPKYSRRIIATQPFLYKIKSGLLPRFNTDYWDALDNQLLQMTEPGKDNVKLAVVAILFTCLALSLGDAIIKQQSAVFLLWQIFILRSLIALPFLLYLLRMPNAKVSIMPLRLKWTLLRSLVLVLMWVFYFTALPKVELAIAAAAYYTLPLFITLFAALFLGDRIGAIGWIAIFLGFIGTVFILQPQSDDFNAYALLPLLSAVCFAIAMIITRSQCRDEKPLVLSLWLNISFVAVGGIATLVISLVQPAADTIAQNPFLFDDWAVMTLSNWKIMAILAVAIIIGSVGAAIAYQNGPPAMIAALDFSYLVYAAIWGWLFFAEVPGGGSLLGMLLILGGGVLAVTRPSFKPKTG
jgi:drug/metabolite transporter (DMT)-like permease